MGRRFPHGFLTSFLFSGKVSCFLVTESHMETRKLFEETIVNIGDNRFPNDETFSGHETLSFLSSFLSAS
jgi:hypothetical protein